MYYSEPNQQDVAEPDAMASGSAGTGQEHTDGITAPAVSSPWCGGERVSPLARGTGKSTARLVKKIGRLVARLERRERHRQRGRYLSATSRNACCRDLITGWLDAMIRGTGNRRETMHTGRRS